MKDSNIVIDQCNFINEKINKKFPNREKSFISGSTNKIIYQIENYIFMFLYPRSRYESDEVMNFKGLKISLDSSKERNYPVSQLLSFLQNDCNFFVVDYKIDTIDTVLDKSIKLIDYIESGKFINWENKYKDFIKKKYPW